MAEEKEKNEVFENLPFLLTPVEFADIMRISKSKAYSFLAQNLIPVVKIGRQMRIRKDDVVNFINRPM